MDKFSKYFREMEESIHQQHVTMQKTMDQQSRVEQGSGDVFIGATDDEQNPEGYGELEFTDGSKYMGFWKNGRQNGTGKEIFLEQDGSKAIYVGHFLEGQKHGLGRYTWADGSNY